jgi:hypothetical protein
MHDKRKAWREQEQQLVERWRMAEERYRDARAGTAGLPPGNDVPAGQNVQKADAARAELEVMRKQIARIKAEFSAGKRY